MPRLALPFVTAVLALSAAFAQASCPTLSSYLLTETDPDKLRVISKLFEIEHPMSGGFEVEVPATQTSLLLSLSPTARLLEKDVSASIRAKLQQYALTSADGYHDFDQVQAWMHDRADANRDLVTVSDYGVSRDGRKLTVMHLLSAASHGKPVVIITAATHGDELITTEVLMNLIDKLIAGYGKDARLTKLVDSHDLYFVPVVNPDGFSETNRYDGPADPNRSYPYPDHLDATPTPSIAGVVKLFQSLDVKASIDFHAYGEMIMYPWAYTHDPIDPVPHARFDALTKHMAEANNYVYGPISDVIYIAPGSSADYYFWKKGSISLGIEVGTEKVPDPSEFPAYFASQEESTWRFLEGI
jgi:hypothetical protein